MLPAMVHVKDRDGRITDVVQQLIAMIATEVDRPASGSEIIVARLTDVLVVFLLRAYI